MPILPCVGPARTVAISSGWVLLVRTLLISTFRLKETAINLLCIRRCISVLAGLSSPRLLNPPSRPVARPGKLGHLSASADPACGRASGWVARDDEACPAPQRRDKTSSVGRAGGDLAVEIKSRAANRC